jgi:ribosomal protein L7/L12
MTEQTNPTPEDGAVELVATVTFRWTYMANPSDYETSDPLEMAAIDRDTFENEQYLQGEPTVTVEPAGKQRVDVVLTEVGPQKLNVIREVRWATPGMTLVAALQMVESAPVAVREDIYEGDATAIVTVLRDAGATVELRPTKRSA